MVFMAFLKQTTTHSLPDVAGRRRHRLTSKLKDSDHVEGMPRRKQPLEVLRSYSRILVERYLVVEPIYGFYMIDIHTYTYIYIYICTYMYETSICFLYLKTVDIPKYDLVGGWTLPL